MQKPTILNPISVTAVAKQSSPNEDSINGFAKKFVKKLVIAIKFSIEKRLKNS